MEQNSLAHVGVMGMKWGHRSGSSSGGGRTGTRGGSSKTNIAKAAAAKTAARKEKIASKAGSLYRHRKEFTPAEMEKAVKNLNLKGQLKTIKKADLDRGIGYAKSVLAIAGTVVATVATAKALGKAAKEVATFVKVVQSSKVAKAAAAAATKAVL